MSKCLHNPHNPKRQLKTFHDIPPANQYRLHVMFSTDNILSSPHAFLCILEVSAISSPAMSRSSRPAIPRLSHPHFPILLPLILLSPPLDLLSPASYRAVGRLLSNLGICFSINRAISSWGYPNIRCFYLVTRKGPSLTRVTDIAVSLLYFSPRSNRHGVLLEM